jgi:predicted flap endonuclease-1-like 5' DNA nuclease
MGYYIDLEKLSIDDYRLKLESAYLPPSRILLKEKLEERFTYFKTLGISNVKDLMQLLKKKDTFSQLSKQDVFAGDYLTILLRELNSTLPKPNKLAEFISISPETINNLEKAGITNTEKLYNKVQTKSDRENLSQATGVDLKDILTLTKLSDLSRIKWVGVTYAQMLHDMGVDTVEKVTMSDLVDLHEQINRMIKEKNIFKGAIGLNDIKILIASAAELTQDIEY